MCFFFRLQSIYLNAYLGSRTRSCCRSSRWWTDGIHRWNSS